MAATERSRVSRMSDADLVDATRRGDKQAFAQLWQRHAAAGRAVARGFTSTFDPDDLVAEAYTRIYKSILDGGGPQAAFRAYLLRTVRNVAVSWQRRSVEDSVDDVDALEDPNSSEESALAALDRGLTASAFRTLPARWQEILWYTEVEQLKAAEIAPLLGIRPNTVAALTYRAREGLRQAWIQAHLASVQADSVHKWTIERLGAYARGGLGKRDQSKVDAHLAECASCHVVASEAEHVNSRLALVLLPLTAGTAGAAAYGAWINTGGNTQAGHALPPSAAVSETVWQPRKDRHRRAGVILLAASSGLLALAITGSATARFLPLIATEQSGESRPADAATSPEPGATASPPSASTPGAPRPSAPSPTPPSSPAPGAPTPSPTTSPAPTTPVPSVAPPGTTIEALSAPVIALVDTGTGANAGQWYPVLHGTAQPGAVVTISNGRLAPTTIRVGADGTWITDQLTGFSAGANTVTVTQTLANGAVSPSATSSFAISPGPSVSAVGGQARFTVTVSGKPSQTVQTFADSDTGWGSAQLDQSGSWQGEFQWFTTAGTHTISSRYGTGNRWGPATGVPVQITR